MARFTAKDPNNPKLTPLLKFCANCKREMPPGQSRRGECWTCYNKVRTAARNKLRAAARAGMARHIGGWQSDDELELMRELGRRDFWTFFLHCFGDGRSPKGQKWIDPAIHEPMANWYQKNVEEWLENRAKGLTLQKHLAVLVHREMGKSRMISAAGQLWLHLRDPELSSYTGSESIQLATKLASIMRGVLDGSDPYSLFTKLYGNWAANARQWTATAMTHSARKQTSRADPSLGTFAVETSIVGAHPDAIFYDDPISYERMLSDENWLTSVNSQVTSLFPVLQSDGIVVWVGTRYDDEDHFGVAFREEGIRSLAGMPCESMEASPEGKWDVYFLAGRDAAGKPTSPKVWPETRLNDYQRRDPLRFASQVMNDPELSEFNPITKDQIKQCYIKSSEVPWSSLRFGITTDIAFWDGKSREKKDETVMIVHGYPRNGSGDVYIIEAYGSPTWRMEDFGHRLVATVQRYRRQGRRIIGISGETARAGLKGSLAANLKNFFADANEPMPPYYEYNRGDTKKYMRMVSAASFWVDGHVRVVESAPGVERIAEQMAKIGQYMVNPKLRNDWADAHSDAFQPEFYQPMRRVGPQKAPYEPGATAMAVEGLAREMFDDSEAAEWIRDCPREPIRS